jgi:hypothetical protein
VSRIEIFVIRLAVVIILILRALITCNIYSSERRARQGQEMRTEEKRIKIKPPPKEKKKKEKRKRKSREF